MRLLDTKRAVNSSQEDQAEYGHSSNDRRLLGSPLRDHEPTFTVAVVAAAAAAASVCRDWGGEKSRRFFGVHGDALNFTVSILHRRQANEAAVLTEVDGADTAGSRSEGCDGTG